jgi:hypothetical protein
MNLFPIKNSKAGQVFLINLDQVTVITFDKKSLQFKFAGNQDHLFTSESVDGLQELVEELMKL